MATKYKVVIETVLAVYDIPDACAIPSKGDIIKFKMASEHKFVVTEVIWNLDETQNDWVKVIVKTELVTGE